MNKQTLNNLTWKYFCEQKKKEIKEWWKEWNIIFIPIGILISVGLLIIINDHFPIIIIASILFILYFFIKGIKAIYNWISSNWKLAKKRALKELNKNK